MPNKVVVHYLDGAIEKGFTSDFQPHKEVFHLIVMRGTREKSIPVKFDNIKAIFFVKDFEGKKGSPDEAKKDFDETWNKDTSQVGKKVKVAFTDGEILHGLTLGYSTQRRGFFFTPIEADSNNERIFALLHAIKDIMFYD